MSASQQSADEVAERLFGSILGTVEVMSVFLGDRLGWYRSLAGEGPASANELARRTGTHARYAREWLEQQAVAGLLTVESDGGPDDRRFAIPASTAEVMTDPTSLAYLAPLGRMFGAVGPVLPQLLEAYRNGGGVSWDQLGDDARESQADANRPWYEKQLGPALAGVPAVHDALAAPGCRVLDVGCGAGWSSISLARAYPSATVLGVDVDEPSIALAEDNARAAGVDDRVRFVSRDAALLPDGTVDVAFAFECVHDMPRPVDVLSAVRRALAPGGSLVVMDEAVADAFAPDGDELERIMYGFSLFVCLPDGLSSAPSVGTGTVMRPSTLQGYGEAAGFETFEVLPIEEFGFWRFYRLS
ncbi:methyltransferase domain-containing protein [Nocardioides sp. LMS-CY]|uniref:class I SAM-dependent methyltransferase n=1 Tax=Nocardioides sp. (strain LMS-CY) TaxID=2840457 RepID=UPI001C004699|nr:class I SAM-dependent methyltransferase [Nocardioides sp. LMS-CY]QWF23311.1 methyltransferase domain-containing protein [Nocardioides sp. LMS-CY]